MSTRFGVIYDHRKVFERDMAHFWRLRGGARWAIYDTCCCPLMIIGDGKVEMITTTLLHFRDTAHSRHSISSSLYA